ncbi:MAG: DNA-directed RNA polymerase subunit F [Palaeococcus sp.]|uniref:RNA polymerase Rpb4 family protein n=1 Tax=Palaeococcus sp. (in: euryarchaeotes) TaxID=2820298 RepID=UPI0025F332E8|nr:RNA polymerase Rpb4 family protein [Palaeococcus sp. (in: euryarchaeotes)]MCD6558592.1 DNA-directed RNA polymerase subunit F [Palaeococcus sp. (in: euryarchaeotes)]
MIGRKKIDEKYVSIAEAQVILKKELEEGLKVNPEEPLHYEARLSLEHTERFSKINPEKVQEVKQKLMEAFEWIDDRMATKLVDIMPEDYFDIRIIFAKEEHMPTKEEAEKIVEILDGYRKE